MSTTWIYLLAATDHHALGAVRSLAALTAAAEGDHIWLRHEVHSASPHPALRQLPALATYQLDQQGLLFPQGKHTPIGRLPACDWQAIASFVPLNVPVSALPGEVSDRYEVRIVPSQTLQEASALRCTLAPWQQYADTAPALRLQQWRFAVSEKGEALVLGTPLPPLPGPCYWSRGDLLLPCGYDLELPVIAPLLARRLNAGSTHLICFDTEGNWEKMEKAHVLPATRSGIRLSKTDE